jgi:hypothetical protein
VSKKKQYIKYKKERVILSDVLPYELPITFTNRYLYNYLLSCKIEVDDKKISINKNDNAVNQAIVRLLFGINSAKPFTDGKVNLDSRNKERVSIPFGYKIAHKQDDYRELIIIHPKNQLLVIDFYNRFMKKNRIFV